jgi:RNA recognition motif-containing protein
MYDRETGRSKGFAFATFANEESVGVAMDASGIELDSKPVCSAPRYNQYDRADDIDRDQEGSTSRIG